MAVGLVAVSSALYLSRVPARSFTPEVRLWCAAYTAFLLTLSLVWASTITRAPRRNREIAFFLPPTLGGELQKVALPEKSRPFLWSRPQSRITPRRAAATNFDLDSPEGSGRKRETRRRERRNIDYGRSFRGFGRARWKWRFCTREREIICPPSPTLGRLLCQRGKRLRAAVLSVTCRRIDVAFE